VQKKKDMIFLSLSYYDPPQEKKIHCVPQKKQHTPVEQKKNKELFFKKNTSLLFRTISP